MEQDVRIDVAAAVSRGDVLQSVHDTRAYVAPHIGNGLIGCCLDHIGLMNDLALDGRFCLIGETYINSQWHFVHGQFGMDYRLPLARITGGPAVRGDAGTHTAARVENLSGHTQRLDLYRGRMEAAYTLAPGGTPAARVKSTALCSQVRKNLLVFRVEIQPLADGVVLDLGLHPVDECDYHYGGHFSCKAPWRSGGGIVQSTVETNLQASVITLLCDPPIFAEGSGVGPVEGRLEVRRPTTVAIYAAVTSSAEGGDPHSAGRSIATEAAGLGFDALAAEQARWWASFWAESAVDLSDERSQKLWTRGKYYLGCSLCDKPSHPPLVFGLARVGWPSYFPQDFLFLYENSMVLGQAAHAASTSRFWLDILPHCEDYARRIFNLPGAVYPWTPPVLRWDDYHKDGVPNHCYFELHNSAYVAKMVHLYASFFGDDAYRRGVAYPVIREIARAYEAMTSFDPSCGMYETRFSPLRSQDEYLNEDLANPFDTLVGIQYTLELACRYAEALGADAAMTERFRGVLSKGLAYSKLERGEGWAAFEGDERPPGSQKHTVQLNPIALLPLANLIDHPRTVASWRGRYRLIQPVEEGAVAWTLGEFPLASAMMGAGAEVERDLDAIQSAGLLDPGLVQCYESAGAKPYFMTTYGLILQALSACLLQWQRGYVRALGAPLPAWEKSRVAFAGFRAPGGFVVSAEADGKAGRILIRSTRGGLLRLYVPGAWREATLYEDGAAMGDPDPGYVLEVDTSPGALYTLAGGG